MGEPNFRFDRRLTYAVVTPFKRNVVEKSFGPSLRQVSVATDAASCAAYRIMFPISALLLSMLGQSFLSPWECGSLDSLLAIKCFITQASED